LQLRSRDFARRDTLSSDALAQSICSPDSTLAVVSIGSNSVTFIDTATNAVKHVTYRPLAA